MGRIGEGVTKREKTESGLISGDDLCETRMFVFDFSLGYLLHRGTER